MAKKKKPMTIYKINEWKGCGKQNYCHNKYVENEEYSRLTDPTEAALDYADYVAKHDSRRMTHEEVFSGIRENLNAQ